MSKEKKKAEKAEKERIGVLVPKSMKNKWQDFADNHDITTVSRLIRNAVNFFIDSNQKISYIENLSKLSHDLKEPLTAIKGFSQLIIENDSSKLEPQILLRIKEIYSQSLFLENKINEILDDIEPEESSYDILLIEDDKSTVMVLSDYFRIKGFSSLGVSTGARGLEELNRHIPKVVLLDIILPDIKGYEVCQKIREIEKLGDVPVYFITAIPETEVKKKLEETGANGFFLKPFDFSKFQELVDKLEE